MRTNGLKDVLGRLQAESASGLAGLPSALGIIASCSAAHVMEMATVMVLAVGLMLALLIARKPGLFVAPTSVAALHQLRAASGNTLLITICTRSGCPRAPVFA